MAKKYVTEVVVKEEEIAVGDVIKNGETAPLWQQVIAAALLEQEVAQLEALCCSIKERVKDTPFVAIKDSLVAAGKISEGENPLLIVSTKYGETLRISMSPATDSGFVVDKSLGDYIDSLPDNMTRTPKKTLESKKVLEALFDSGEIPDIYKGYFSKSPREITKITVKSKEGGK